MDKLLLLGAGGLALYFFLNRNPAPAVALPAAQPSLVPGNIGPVFNANINAGNVNASGQYTGNANITPALTSAALNNLGITAPSQFIVSAKPATTPVPVRKIGRTCATINGL
jgi:hypothetical protein